MKEHPLDNFVFFGSSTFSIVVLDELAGSGFLPKLIVTAPSERAGRKMQTRDPEVKTWAEKKGIPIIQPVRLDAAAKESISAYQPECLVVASYGKIIPRNILDLPLVGAFNIHPSFLPKYRGPSPIQSQILSDEKERGVSVIKMDERVDHGPLLASSAFNGSDLPFIELGTELFKAGTRLLIDGLGKLHRDSGTKLTPQDDTQATFTKKFDRSDGAIDPEAGRESWLKYLALSHSPGVHFVYSGKSGDIRLKITSAKFEDGRFIPLRVIPEAKREMSYQDFLRGQK